MVIYKELEFFYSLKDKYNDNIFLIGGELNNNLEIIDSVRECYIDGCWNKDTEEEYLTEIQFPVRRK